MSEGGFLRRLKKLVLGEDTGAAPVPPARPQAPAAGPQAKPPLDDESWLEERIRQVARSGDVRDVGTASFWDRIDGLIHSGRGKLAAEWLEKFAAAVPDGEKRHTLRARAADLRLERGETGDALPHLEALTRVPDRAARSHFLLGDHYRRQGDIKRALRHFESVLAIDVDYPNARARVEALRKRRGDPGLPGGAEETVVGPQSAGAAGMRYHLVRELGRGATGVVYLARDMELERDVALKLLHPHLSSQAQAAARSRFFDEARITASLRHPNIIAILDLDEEHRRLVMELCTGGTLKARLAAGPLPAAAALQRHVEVLSALSAAHARGVIHRDLKPANLLFRGDPEDPDSEIVLGDFGIAHLVPAAAAADRRKLPRRRDRDALGTLGYMAPEQRRGEAQGPRVDVYAAAVLLHETLTGALPWDRDTLLRGVRKPGDLAIPGADAALNEHLLALGHPDARKRPDTTDALARARDLARRLGPSTAGAP